MLIINEIEIVIWKIEIINPKAFFQDWIFWHIFSYLRKNNKKLSKFDKKLLTIDLACDTIISEKKDICSLKNVAAI